MRLINGMVYIQYFYSYLLVKAVRVHVNISLSDVLRFDHHILIKWIITSILPVPLLFSAVCFTTTSKFYNKFMLIRPL